MRDPAPPYANEGPHALWHVSEDPSIERFALHDDAEIELRVLPNLLPLWHAVAASTLEFSGMRLRNAQPAP